MGGVIQVDVGWVTAGVAFFTLIAGMISAAFAVGKIHEKKFVQREVFDEIIKRIEGKVDHLVEQVEYIARRNGYGTSGEKSRN